MDAKTIQEFNAYTISEAAAMNFISNNPLNICAVDNKKHEKCPVSSSRALMSVDFQKHKTLKHSSSLDFLFDTGASVSLLSPQHFELFRKKGLVLREIDCSPTIRDASGSPMQNNGVYNISFYYEKNKLNGVFIVSKSLSGPPIIGMNITQSRAGSQSHPA